MSYENFVQRTSFSTEQRNVTFEVTPEKMACIEQIAISLGAEPSSDSSPSHHYFNINGKNSEHILHAIEMAWASLDNYEKSSSSLVIISGKKSTVILPTTLRNNILIGSIYLLACISGITVEKDGTMEVSPRMYKVFTDFILNQKEE